MVAAKIITLLSLALGALAAPVAAPTDNRPFKLAVQIGSKQLYLSPKGDAVPDRSAGITCTMNRGAIACGDAKQGYTYDNRHTPEYSPLVPTKDASENKNWKIVDGTNEVKWAAKSGGDVHFSTKPMFGNTIFAEICTTYGHPDRILFTPHTVKADFV